MNKNLPKPGTTCYVKDFEDDGWHIRTFCGVSKGPLFRYITYDQGNDEVEEWIMIRVLDKD